MILPPAGVFSGLPTVLRTSDRFFVGLAGASMGTSAAVFSASAMVILRIQVNDDGCSKWLQWRRNIKQMQLVVLLQQDTTKQRFAHQNI